MNNVNPTALLRSLIVYAVCVPLAIIVGYLLTSLDYQSMGLIGFLAAIMIFPLLMKWHYPLLVLSWAMPVTLFFLPGHPTLFLAMAAISLTISVVERILDRNKPFLPTGGVAWPLLAFLLVIVITAKLTGGFGLRSMGSDVYGGKKYIFLIVGILSFFAITARPIPKRYANLYVGLYFAGGILNFVSDMYSYVPSPLHFIYQVIPPSIFGTGLDDDAVLGVSRMGGVATAAGCVFSWLLALYGFRDNMLTSKFWRPVLMGITFILMFLGGFRAIILGAFIMLALIFYLEKMHRTGMMMVMLLGGLLGAALLVPMAPHLPFTFQRALAFLPLNISPEARLNADASTEWRLEIWQALLPQVPKYLLLGKGYAFSAETFNESMGRDAMFQKTIDAAENPLALAGDFHSGPLSVVLSFGVWGVIVWLWYWVAGFFVVWRNYKYGDPALAHINRYFFAAFIAKCFGFLFIFGDVVGDVGGFAGLIGMSIALNHGIMRRPAQTTAPIRINQNPRSGQPRFPVRPAFQR